MKANLHINATPMNTLTESRTGRSVDLLLEYSIFDRIDIAAAEDQESEYKKDKVRILSFKRNYDVEKASLFTKVYGTLKWCFSVYKKLSSQKYQVINCHSINLLPLSVVLKFKNQSLLIYDIHELETETLAMTTVRKFFSKIVEKIFIGFVDYTIVVSEPIKDWYVKKYKIENISVIRNMPSIQPDHVDLNFSLRDKFQIPKENIVFIYHGALLKGRGIERLISIFSKLSDKSKHLVIIGFGELEETCRFNAQNNENIHFNEALEKNELLEFIKEADVGLNFIDNSCLNHEFCLPNKLWDYLSVPMPIMVNNLEGMRTVIEEYECGWLVEEDNKSVKAAIENLNRNDLLIKKNKAENSLENWGWKFEKQKLLEIYQQILKKYDQENKFPRS